VGGAARCRACMWDKTECRVNTMALLQWRTKVEAGQVTVHTPTGTSCKRCNTILHRTCDLLGAADLREKVNEKKAEVPAKKAEAEAKKTAVGGEEEKEESEAEDDEGEEEEEEEEEEEDGDIVIEEQEQEEPERDAEE